MVFVDKNQTLQPPVGYKCVGVVANGAYLQVIYISGVSRIVVYLNDMGREVGRTETALPLPTPIKPKQEPISRWFRFRNGWLIVLEGLTELIRCLNKS